MLEWAGCGCGGMFEELKIAHKKKKQKPISAFQPIILNFNHAPMLNKKVNQHYGTFEKCYHKRTKMIVTPRKL
jgi:hypothetical protein